MAESTTQRVRCRAVFDCLAAGRGCHTAAEPRERARALAPTLGAGIRARWARGRGRRGGRHLYSGLLGSAWASISCVTERLGKDETAPGNMDARSSRDRSSLAFLMSSLSVIGCATERLFLFLKPETFFLRSIEFARRHNAKRCVY